MDWKPQYKKSDLKVGDIIGVIADAMYEFKILSYSEEQKGFHCKCTKSGKGIVKKGELRLVLPEQVFLKLGEKGKKFPK